jgi:hypothetical protein
MEAASPSLSFAVASSPIMKIDPLSIEMPRIVFTLARPAC